MNPIAPSPPPVGSLEVLSCCTTGPRAMGSLPLARAVQYPESLQLQLWLPDLDPPEGWQNLQLHDAAGQELLDLPMQHCLQARTRVLLDAAPWPVGELRLEVAHRLGLHLRLHLLKRAAPAPTLPQPTTEADPGEDLRWRQTRLQQLARRFAWRLSYESRGRSGRVLFHEHESCLVFPWEMTGDAAEPLVIAVPTATDWERRTGRLLTQREDILRFVAETAQREQSRSWQVEVRDDAIVFLASP